MSSTKPLHVIVLVSGSGTLLQSIMDHQDETYQVVHVIADKQCQGIERARAAGISTTVVEFFKPRQEWDIRLTEAVAESKPDIIVSAGFMRILGAEFLAYFGGKTINTHPALLPSFPGAHGVRDALNYGVKVTGSTVHFVDEGVDTGAIIAQEPVKILADDTESSLHERIKKVERQLIVSVLRRADIEDHTGKVYFPHD